MRDEINKNTFATSRILQRYIFLSALILMAVMLCVQTVKYFDNRNNVLLSMQSGYTKTNNYHDKNPVYAVELEARCIAAEGISIKINGRNTVNLLSKPVTLFLQKGDVLEIDAYGKGYSEISISAIGSRLPEGWSVGITINNQRYRFPVVN